MPLVDLVVTRVVLGFGHPSKRREPSPIGEQRGRERRGLQITDPPQESTSLLWFFVDILQFISRLFFAESNPLISSGDDGNQKTTSLLRLGELMPLIPQLHP